MGSPWKCTGEGVSGFAPSRLTLKPQCEGITGPGYPECAYFLRYHGCRSNKGYIYHESKNEWFCTPNALTAMLKVKEWLKTKFGSIQHTFEAVDMNRNGDICLTEMQERLMANRFPEGQDGFPEIKSIFILLNRVQGKKENESLRHEVVDLLERLDAHCLHVEWQEALL